MFLFYFIFSRVGFVRSRSPVHEWNGWWNRLGRGDKRVLDTQIELLKLERVKTGVFRVDDISSLSSHITLGGVGRPES